MSKPEAAACVCDDKTAEAELILVATTTCPNCKMAEKFLNDAGVTFTKVYADKEPEVARKYNVKGAPVLVIDSGNGFEKIENVSNIRKFAEANK